jgi:hypothetical protein
MPKGWARSPARWPPRCSGSSPTTLSPRASWSDATGSSRPPSCPAATSHRRPTSTIQFGDWLIANARVVRTIKARPVDLLDADRAAMLPLPPVPPAVGLGQPGPARTRLLRPRRFQRLLGRPSGDRPVRRRDRRPVPRRGPPRRAPRRHPRPGLGARDDDHRSRPRRGRQGAARTVPAAPTPAAADDGLVRTWPTTTARSASPTPRPTGEVA